MTPQEAFDFRREGRLLSALLAAELCFGLLQMGVLIIMEERSVVALVARLAGHPSVLAVLFFALAGLLTPYFLMQLFNPTMARRIQVVRVTVYALLASGVLRIYFAYLSRNLDVETVTGIFALNGVWCIAMAAVLAYSINNKQKRYLDEA